MLIRPADREALREAFRHAKPFPFLLLDDFLEPAFAREVSAAYPGFEEARRRGRWFQAVNEHGKVQVTDPRLFPEPVLRLHELLQSPGFLDDLSAVTGIRGLVADPELRGGGMHLTGSQGRLDVHADFNLLRDRGLHRRLNLLLYLNPVWDDAWGGEVELWDRDVKTCCHSIKPLLNRCVIFATSEISYHGVTAVRCPAGYARQSFAAYYYTREPPEDWDGRFHSTVFRARPDERLRRYVLMPAERVWRRLRGSLRRSVRRLRGPWRSAS